MYSYQNHIPNLQDIWLSDKNIQNSTAVFISYYVLNGMCINITEILCALLPVAIPELLKKREKYSQLLIKC